MLELLFRLIAPHRCCSCVQKGRLLCDNCKNNIISEPYEQCIFCEVPSLNGVCSRCSRHYGVRQAWCLGERRDGLLSLGNQYKFECKREGGHVFTELLDAVLPILPRDMAVVSIPTSSRSVRERGFDCVGAVAKRLARCRGFQVATPLVRATDATLHFLDYAERVRLKDSLFTLSGAKVPKKILLIDDIVTTGTTLSAAVRLLRQGGATDVYIAVWARQPSRK